MTTRWRAPDAVLVGTTVLAFAAAAAVAASGRSGASAVVGIGLGRAVDVSRCAAAFDAREDGSCRLRHDPVPCLGVLCPDHALRSVEDAR